MKKRDDAKRRVGSVLVQGGEAYALLNPQEVAYLLGVPEESREALSIIMLGRHMPRGIDAFRCPQLNCTDGFQFSGIQGILCYWPKTKERGARIKLVHDYCLKKFQQSGELNGAVLLTDRLCRKFEKADEIRYPRLAAKKKRWRNVLMAQISEEKARHPSRFNKNKKDSAKKDPDRPIAPRKQIPSRVPAASR